MITQNIKLGANELKLLFTLEEENRSIFTINVAKQILGTSDSSVWNVIYRLKKKGRIEEIEKGKYLLIPARAGYDGSWSEVPNLIVPYIIDIYSPNEILVEKLRSILQRGKARDYYDVWRLLKEKDFDQGKIGELLIETSNL